MQEAPSAFTQSPWDRMRSYSRFRLFGAETPVVLDYIALVAIIVVTDVLSSWPGWIEMALTVIIWGTSITATSYFRAKAELDAERLVELQSRSVPRMRETE